LGFVVTSDVKTVSTIQRWLDITSDQRAEVIAAVSGGIETGYFKHFVGVVGARAQ